MLNKDYTYCVNNKCPLQRGCKRRFVVVAHFETIKLSFFNGAYNNKNGKCEHYDFKEEEK